MHRAHQPFAGHETHHQFFTEMDNKRRNQHGKHQRRKDDLFDFFRHMSNLAEQHKTKLTTRAQP